MATTGENPMPESSITVTSHQATALCWLTDRVQHGAHLVALRGLAGTGKTTLIPPLRNALHTSTRQVFVGTPTHRAAMILRAKGIPDAGTVHSLCMTPYFTAEYRLPLRIHEILYGSVLGRRDARTVLSSTYPHNELMRLCLLRWQSERRSAVLRPRWRVGITFSFNPHFLRVLTSDYQQRKYSLA